MRNLTLVFFFLINLSVSAQNGQGRYSNSEIDQKIELSQKDNNLTEERLNNFRRELDTYKENYEYRAKEQDGKISFRNDVISILFGLFSIMLALAGFVAYKKVKSDVRDELEEIKTLKAEAKTILEEAKELSKNIKETAKDADKNAKEIEKWLEYVKQPTQSLTEDKQQELSEFVKEEIEIKTDEDLTADDWLLKGYNAAIKAENSTDETKKESELRNAILYYEKAADLDSTDEATYNNLGLAIADLAKIKKDEKLFELSFEKYEKAISINDKYDSAFYNWGLALCNLAKIKQDEKLILEGIEKCKIAYQLNSENSYNLACGYALIKNKKEALHYLEETLKNKNEEIDYILNDEDWKNYLEDKDFIDLIENTRDQRE